MDSRFYTRDPLNFSVGLSKRYLKREISALYFLLCFSSFCFSIVSTCWRFSCTFIDYSEVISLVWMTRSFYPCIKRFFTLNNLCLLCALNFYFTLYILLVFLIGCCKFEEIYFRCLLLCYWVLLLCWYIFSHQIP